MIRLIAYFMTFAAIVVGVVWLNENPGFVDFTWFDYHIKMSMGLFLAVVLTLITLCILMWRLIRGVIGAPDAFGLFLSSRRRNKGYDALSKGIIAVGSGDVKNAAKYARLADSKLDNEPLTLLLKAQTAQLEGNKQQAHRAFEKMTEQDATKMLGLRGLFVEAQRNDDNMAAKLIALDAVSHDGTSKWALNALFDLQTEEGDWGGALNSLLMIGRLSSSNAKQMKRKRAVLLTAEAMDIEISNPERALELSLEAKTIAGDLVPATLIAVKLLLAKGSVRKAHKLLEKCWRLAPHPNLGALFAKQKDDEKPKARLKRVQGFALKASVGNADSQEQAKIEAAVLVARVAIEQEDWTTARTALENIVANGPSARICTLMAKIEQGEFGNKGIVAEWLARAQNAPGDPMWLADGHIAEQWAPTSAITGELDAYEWKLPAYNLSQVESDMAANILLEHQQNEFQMFEAQDKIALEAKVEKPVEPEKVDKTDDGKDDEPSDGSDGGSGGGGTTELVVKEKTVEPVIVEPVKEIAKLTSKQPIDDKKLDFQPADASPQKAGKEKSKGLATKDAKAISKSSSPYRSKPVTEIEQGGEQLTPSRRPDDPGPVGEGEGVNFQPEESIGYYSSDK